MNGSSSNELKEHYLYPGNIFVDVKPYRITTILGSCVSVCLWDTRLKIGAMNHFILPLWNGNGLATPKYGNIAIKKIIDKMLTLGSQKKDLVAKIFGGAAVLNTSNNKFNIGDRNVSVAFDFIREEKIPIVSQDVGGLTGRKILFFTNTGRVFGKLLGQTKSK